jgi:hypothetical protein
MTGMIASGAVPSSGRQRIYQETFAPVLTGLVLCPGGAILVAVLAYPDRQALACAGLLLAFGITYAYCGGLGVFVEVRDGKVVIANLFRRYAIPLRRLIDFSMLDSVAVYANTTDGDEIEVSAMTMSTSAGTVRRMRRKITEMSSLVDGYPAEQADGPVTVRFRWETLVVIGIGIAGFAVAIVVIASA